MQVDGFPSWMPVHPRPDPEVLIRFVVGITDEVEPIGEVSQGGTGGFLSKTTAPTAGAEDDLRGGGFQVVNEFAVIAARVNPLDHSRWNDMKHDVDDIPETRLTAGRADRRRHDARHTSRQWGDGSGQHDHGEQDRKRSPAPLCGQP